MENFSALFFNSSAFIIVLTIIVFCHEFGHYYIAKISGVKIEMFSIGFGKELFGFTDKSGTRWKFCLLPLGGYVKMFGDTDPASAPDTEKINNFTKDEEKIAFHTQPLFIKAAIVAAGPLANFLLAILIMTFFFSYYGKPITTPQINTIVPNSAAYEAGMLPGDIVTNIDGTNISNFSDIQRVMAINTGTEITVTLLRGDEELILTATPQIKTRLDIFGNEIKAALLGISSTHSEYKKLNIASAFASSVVETYNISMSTLTAIGQMISGQRSVKEITGPIGIAKYSGQSAQQGLSTILWFITILSINLGLVNLFPIPALDGGHLLYYSIEAVRGKPMADKIQQIGMKIGIAFIITLAIFAIINDLLNL